MINEKAFNVYFPLHACTNKQKKNVKNLFSIIVTVLEFPGGKLSELIQPTENSIQVETLTLNFNTYNAGVQQEDLKEVKLKLFIVCILIVQVN